VRAVDVPSGIEQAVAALEPGGRLVSVRALTGGVSANVFALEIATPDARHRRVVFRQHRADFKQHDRTVTAKEHAVLAALHREGLAVPEPYLCDDTGADTAPYLLMEWVDGSTDVAPADLPRALDQMARFLVGLHALDPGALPLVALEPIEDPRVAVVPYLPTTAVGRDVMATLAVGDSAARHSRRVLVHGDFWPGNVIWCDGQLAAVIDWEDASLGDPLADLATARVELLSQYGQGAMARFTAAYLSMHEDTIGPLLLDALPVWELYVSAAALASMSQWGLDPADEAHRRHHTERFFEQAAGRLA
jgi:aminoglycoside phosphotransferase (APT) family kinase protein